MFALEAFLQTVPHALVDAAARDRIRAAGDHLPDALTDAFGLELRLGDDPRVDLAVRVCTTRQLSVLAGNDPRIRLPGHLAGLPAWRRAAHLAQRSLGLLRAGSPLPAEVWLEFDLDGAAGPPLPAVFVAAAPPAGRRSTGLAAGVRMVHAAGLPVRQIGVFGHRTGSGIRLVTGAAPPPERCLAALDACGWAGPADELVRWMLACAPRCDELRLALDLTADGLAPQVGVETFFAGLPQPRDEPRWDALLAALAVASPLAPGKREALAGLGTGYTARLLTPRRYRQGLHHLKVVLGTGQAAVAKAYVGARADAA